jgi:FlaA1/EpsC-like NDP-sugar epimerase
VLLPPHELPLAGARRHFTQRCLRLFLRNRAWFLGIFQGVLILTSLVLAWLLRFDFALPQKHLLLNSAIILLLVRLPALWAFGLFHGWWRYSGVNDALSILKAILTGSLVFLFVMLFLLRWASFPGSIYVLEGVITAGLLSGIRLFSRALAESARRDLDGDKKVILIGAGFAAQMILREINRPGSGLHAVGCLDDDESKRRLKLHGVSVLGKVTELASVLKKVDAEEVLIAVPSATGQEMQRFVNICRHASIPFRTVPALRDLIAGQVIVSQLREVKLEDLLGRDPAKIDLDSVRREIKNQTVLVTGAAGSIGSEICRQILSYSPATLLCLDQNETGIFYLQRDLDRIAPEVPKKFFIVDVKDADDVRAIFLTCSPQIIFHAAAYKHVPLMEANPRAAFENNVFAFLSLLALAEESSCKSLVLISSDKAVNPTSVMGASKRLCELIASSRPRNGMRCVSVRFGNVLGSSGSVVPVLQEQLRSNLPLTVTHPEIRRFFMTTREAVALVLQAFALGEHGDILVLDMGKPVRILDLARNLIRLSGKSEEAVKIEITGLRDGEKLEEELHSRAEALHPTSCERIRRVVSPVRRWSELMRQLDELREVLFAGGQQSIRSKIKDIIPEFANGAAGPSPIQSAEEVTAQSAD